MRIDVFPHILPRPFFDAMLAETGPAAYMQKRVREVPVLYDLDARFAVMERFGDYVQVLTLANPPIEAIAGPERATALARIGNDAMADLVRRHPDRFVGFAAGLPMNAPDEAVRELERAIDALGARGIQLFTNVNGKPLDLPEFEPIFAAMAERDLPIWIHPARGSHFPDYATEDRSRLELWWVFGWPYETSVAMARLAFAGVFDRYPDLKVICHHGGGLVPHLSGRIGPGLDQLGARTPEADAPLVRHRSTRRPFDYFKMFYVDAALFGSRHATRCTLDFYGVDHVLFGSDMPFDPEKGPGYIRETIASLDAMRLDAAARRAIDEGNARRLLRLDRGRS